MLPETEHRPRLLIADDDPTLAETMREVLEEDFAVEVTSDGSEALARAQQDRPDVLVIDAQMPRMDGLRACRALRRDPRTADLPIIMVTGCTGPEFVREAFAAGVTDYLPKPFSISQLRARATTWLLRQRAS
ncbi:MAG: response regulator [Chloroflexi bacterium]|nr:response regulator [Chloroflexota bacterium]